MIKWSSFFAFCVSSSMDEDQFSADDIGAMLTQIVQELKKTTLHSQLKQAAQVSPGWGGGGGNRE